MSQNLGPVAGEPVTVSFTPILVPMPRGILATCTAKAKPGVTAATVRAAYAEAYAAEPFVHLLPEGQWPQTAAGARLQLRPPPGRPVDADAGPGRRGQRHRQPRQGHRRRRGAEREHRPRPARRRSGLPVTESHREHHRTDHQSTGVTAARGFRAAGVAAGIKASGTPDLALVVNDGPASPRPASSPPTGSRPLRCSGSEQVSRSGQLAARSCSTPVAPTPAPARRASRTPTPPPSRSPPRSASRRGRGRRLLHRPDRRAAADGRAAAGGRRRPSALVRRRRRRRPAIAIMTTDTVAKTAVARRPRLDASAAWPRARACSRRGWPRCCGAHHRRRVPTRRPGRRRCARPPASPSTGVDSDGCMSTNDTVLLLASGASGVTPDRSGVHRRRDRGLRRPGAPAGRRRRGRQQGHRRSWSRGAATEDDAVEVARAVARSNLLKCALHGEDPNWGRVLSAVGTTDAAFEPGPARRRHQRRLGLPRRRASARTATWST